MVLLVMCVGTHLVASEVFVYVQHGQKGSGETQAVESRGVGATGA